MLGDKFFLKVGLFFWRAAEQVLLVYFSLFRKLQLLTEHATDSALPGGLHVFLEAIEETVDVFSRTEVLIEVLLHHLFLLLRVVIFRAN
jgi:hypothetical protein